MVKAVVGEESQLKLAENRLSKSGLPCQVFNNIFMCNGIYMHTYIDKHNFFWQVGLVIGNLSWKLDRGFVFDLIPTPPNDNGEPACSIIGGVKDDRKKASKGKSHPDSSALFIDKDWVAEHARQVHFYPFFYFYFFWCVYFMLLDCVLIIGNSHPRRIEKYYAYLGYYFCYLAYGCL